MERWTKRFGNGFDEFAYTRKLGNPGVACLKCDISRPARLQVDVRKIAPRLYQYTPIDDCPRYNVLTTLFLQDGEQYIGFLDAVIEEMPFAFQ